MDILHLFRTRIQEIIKISLFLVLILSSTQLYSQQFEAQLDSLAQGLSPEELRARIPTALRVLAVDPMNVHARSFLKSAFRWSYNNRKPGDYLDSILEVENLNPYVLIANADALHRRTEDSTSAYYYFKMLNICLQLETVRLDAATLLSETYYLDFIKPTEVSPPTEMKMVLDSLDEYNNNKQFAEVIGLTLDSLLSFREQSRQNLRISKFKYSADSALKYLSIVIQSDTFNRSIYSIPYVQIQSSQGVKVNYTLDSNLYNGNYLPSWYYGYLPKNWASDLTVNLWREIIYNAGSDIYFLSEQLKDLEEPILYNTACPLTYRITWLPSFNHPIVFRIERHNSKAFIYWKIGKGMGGYRPEGILDEGRDKISLQEFDRISGVLDTSELSYDITYTYAAMTDGVSMYLERYKGNEFKAFNTNLPSYEVENLLLELVKKYIPKEEDDVRKYFFGNEW